MPLLPDLVPRARHLILDLDGTVYLGDELLPGAGELLEVAEETGRTVTFLTNNSSKHVRQYVARLTELLGRPIAERSIFTSTGATIQGLNERGVSWIYPVGTPAFEEEMREAGFVFEAVRPQAVVLAFDRTLTTAKIEHTARLLQQGVEYYATHPDRVCPMPDGAVPDCGALCALFEAATGRRPDAVFGKPDPTMLRGVLSRVKAAPEEALMVGDRLYTDIRMGRQAGVPTLLVLTGEATEAAVQLADPGDRPDVVLAGLPELVEAMKRGMP